MNKIKTEMFMNQLKYSNLENNTPVLFNKKQKKIVCKLLNYISSDTGKTRHFTPAAQEWFNSIYTYNNNYIKTLPVADKNLMTLLKSYFNFQINRELLKAKTKPMQIRFKRLSTNRIFVGKGELKHTSNKVIITFYVHNTEGMFLSSNLKAILRGLYYPEKDLEKFINKDNGKKTITYNRPFTLLEYLSLRDHYEWYLSYITSIVNKLTTSLSVLNTYYESLSNLVQTKVLTDEDKLLMFNEKVLNFKTLNYPNFNAYINKADEEYKKERYRYNYLLNFNKAKFTNYFIFKLIILVKKIYNKDVEFNIVNLKKMHLNSDIFTQAVSLKLKNRDNKLYRVLKSSLRKIKLPIERKISEKQNKPNRDEFFVNRIRNNIISSMFINNNANDPLNDLLLDFYPSADNLEINIIKRSSVKNRSISLKNSILRSLKHMKLRGIRVEAKGRLTRRFTASRSVFKMKWKGGLKNVDSSFKGLSTIMLRGHLKSNVQYSVINSKNRNGAFGVKGWVSNK